MELNTEELMSFNDRNTKETIIKNCFLSLLVVVLFAVLFIVVAILSGNLTGIIARESLEVPLIRAWIISFPFLIGGIYLFVLVARTRYILFAKLLVDKEKRYFKVLYKEKLGYQISFDDVIEYRVSELSWFLFPVSSIRREYYAVHVVYGDSSLPSFRVIKYVSKEKLNGFLGKAGLNIPVKIYRAGIF